jgi:ketopantoate reductase
MKIAVVGCGAVGSYYGARLGRAGQEVHFLLRSDFEAVRQNGVAIRSPAGNFTIHPHCARTPDEIGICDVVLIGLKTTANDQFPKLLPPSVGRRLPSSRCKTVWATRNNWRGSFPRNRFSADSALSASIASNPASSIT